MLTTAVFSICLTAPLGAILINTLGTKWLNYDGPPADIVAPEKIDNEAGVNTNVVVPSESLEGSEGSKEKDKGVSTGREAIDDVKNGV